VILENIAKYKNGWAKYKKPYYKSQAIFGLKKYGFKIKIFNVYS
jgi:hypothetical protein